MKKICNTAIALLIFLLLSGITSCKTEEEFTTHWETFSIDVENHFDEVRNTILQKTGKVEADNDEGYDFCKYTVSADSSITASSINNISLALTHLAVTLQKPRMSKYLFRQWKVKCHQHNRPVNGVETKNIFSNQMQICRPVFFI